MHKWDFRNTYYLIIYRVREWGMWGVWDLKTPVGVRRDAISVHFWCIFLDKEKAYKIENQYLVGFILRRERDSNPRYLSVRRFSRPVQSTTLPPLQGLFFNENVVSFRLMMQRYIKKIYRASILEKFFEKS